MACQHEWIDYPPGREICVWCNTDRPYRHRSFGLIVPMQSTLDAHRRGELDNDYRARDRPLAAVEPR